MKVDSLKKLYVHELKDLYSAENQILEALPKMIAAAQDTDLKKAFKDHLKETATQVRRLEKIFSKLGAKPGGQKCKGMEGLLTEGEEIIKDAESDPEVRDAGLISAAQRVEHYEMAGYGTARTFAEKLGDLTAADLLQQTLDEEGHADQHLTRLALRKINAEAAVAA